MKGVQAVMGEGNARRWWILGAVQVGNFVVYMDSFIVTLALPTMARAFGCGLHEVKWVLVAYLITLTMGLLVAGRLADRFGRKAVTVAGMAGLGVGAALCLMAPGLWTLVASRVVQGVGAALVLANVMAEIAATFPREERRKAMAVNASVLAMGQVCGLLAGGWLIEWMGWRSIFGLIAGIALAGLVLDLGILKSRTGEREGARFDYPGGVLSLLAVGAPFLVIERLNDGAGWGAAVACLVAAGVFLGVEWRTKAPLLDPRLFKIRSFVCGSLAAMFYFVAATFTYFLIPLYAQVVLEMSPFHAGLLMVPLSVALTTASQMVGKCPPQVGARIVSTAGIFCVMAGVLGLSFLNAASPVAEIVFLVMLVGAGGGVFHPPNNTAVLNRVPPEILGSANGFFTMARNFGAALGASLAAALLVSGLGHEGAMRAMTENGAELAGSGLRALYVQAQQNAFRIGAWFACAGVLFSIFRGPPAPLSGK